MRHSPTHLKRFVDTLNWRPDLAAYVLELDLREWGDCPMLEDYVGEMDGEQYNKKLQKLAAIKKGRQKGTLMDDELLRSEADEVDQEESAYEEEHNNRSEGFEDEMSMDGSEDEIFGEELRFLGPSQPLNHHDCNEGQCEFRISKTLTREARELGFGMVITSNVTVLSFKVPP